MTIFAAAISVPVSPTVIAIDTTSTHISYPSAGTLYNPGPNTVFLGPANVTAATGFPVPTNATFQWEFHSEALYATCSIAQNVNIIRRG
jgi:hypothetical protein